MLNDHFEMMMEMMQNAKMGKGKGKQKGNMKLSEMQQQLNQQIEDVKKGGKNWSAVIRRDGTSFAAEQEAIRKGLQEWRRSFNSKMAKKRYGNIAGQMEQTEMDLVNKQITEQTIRRQKDILQRLLESEKVCVNKIWMKSEKERPRRTTPTRCPREFWNI